MRAINDSQREVLRWVAKGSPDGVMEDYSHRVSASALRSRGLVRITGRGPSLRAELTDAGRALVDQLPSNTAPAREGRRGGAHTSASVEVPAPRSGEKRSKTQQLVGDVVAAGGKLVLPDDTARGGVDWRQRAYAAQRHGKVPAGKHLTVSLTTAGFEIELRDGETGNELGADAVPVPAQLRNYHPAVRQFREQTSLQQVSRKALSRACRMMHALAVALEKRGHRVTYRAKSGDEQARARYSGKPASYGRFVVTINGHDLTWLLSENGVGLRGPWEERKRQREENRNAFRFDRWDVGRIEPYDKSATGQLELSIDNPGPRQTKWGDRKRWRLEDRLPQVMRELEVLAEEAEERRIARERAEEERQRAWELAMVEAKARAIEHQRVELLERRVAAWREAVEIRAYCDAVEARHREAVGTDPEAEQWLRFARERADRLQQVPRIPPEPELKHDELTPFLGGWSPYGPHRGRW